MISFFTVLAALLWCPRNSLAKNLVAQPEITQPVVQIVDQPNEKQPGNLRRRRQCSPSVSVPRDNFEVGEELQVLVNICQNWAYEWFGVWAAGTNPGTAPAVNWQFTCAGQTCASPQNVGGFLFGLNEMTVSVGYSSWPLPSGPYVIYYYSVFGVFSSSTFTIGSVSNTLPGNVATYHGDVDFSASPLGECQGDCDRNSDCMPGYFCWQRDEGEQIPYCAGAKGSIDYCVPESESPGKKLRLQWDNYFWQETYEEFFYCMSCTECDTLTAGDGWEGGCKDPPGNKCEEGHLIWIHRCKYVRDRFEILQNPGSGDQIRVYGTNLCFSTINRYMELRPCNNTIENQLWTPIENREKFELRPYNQRDLTGKEAKCISQLHHPKSTEVLSLRECWLNILYETNYWMEWY